jgi:tetratricopeptide (TPR) repeat protein
LLTIGLFSSRKRLPYAFCGWIWYGIVLFPVSGIFQIGGQSIADRFTYLPFVGLYIALIWGAAECIQRFRIKTEIVIAACGLVLVTMMWKSWTQTETWHDSIALYAQALKASGGNEPMHRNLAAELAAQGKIPEAIAHYREAIRLDAGRAGNYFALGHLLANEGLLGDAAKELSAGLRRAPEYTPGRKELGFVYMRLNRLPEAAAAFQRVIREAPNDTDIIPIKALVETLPPPADTPVTAEADISVEPSQHGPSPSVKQPLIRPDLPWTVGMVAACVALALLLPTFGRSAFRSAERALDWLSRKKAASIATVAILPIAIRLAVLPIHPIPQPIIADEFGYLLIADTFANGRVTNPTPPMWEHFVTQYEFFQPTYAAKYPFGEPAFMAAAQMFGFDAWYGVCLGVGLMCVALYWMLRGWVPPRWALLGGLLFAFRYGVTSYWMNSYWGGAIAAAGGALVIGALPRIKRHARVRDAILMAIGLLLLANTRPYEGFLLAIPAGIMVAWWLFRARTGSLADRFRLVVLPASAVLAVGISFMLYYNWRVTGHALLMPYQWNQKLYGTPTPFYFQRPISEPPGLARYKDLRDNFLWQKENYNARLPLSNLAAITGEKLASVWDFFVQPALTIPLLFVPFIWRKRELRPVLSAAVFVLAGIGLYPFFFPHYAAPIFAIFVLVIVEGLRRTRLLTWKGRPVGAFLYAALILLVVCTTTAEIASPIIEQAKTIRSEALRRFEAAGGKHLVMVHYKPDHLFHYGWVYNNADIDGSSVVWARDLDAKSNEELFRYYHDRNIWLFEVDERPARLSRYPGTETKTAGL